AFSKINDGSKEEINQFLEESCHCENSLPEKKILFLNHKRKILEKLLSIIKGTKSILIDLKVISKKITSICRENLNPCTDELKNHVQESLKNLEKHLQTYEEFRNVHSLRSYLVTNYTMYNELLQGNFKNAISMDSFKDYLFSHFSLVFTVKNSYERLLELNALTDLEKSEFQKVRFIANNFKSIGTKYFFLEMSLEELESRVEKMKSLYDTLA
ncbi:hypothetical protein HMI54_003365, partial [Coelomomyces lativittatus]